MMGLGALVGFGLPRGASAWGPGASSPPLPGAEVALVAYVLVLLALAAGTVWLGRRARSSGQAERAPVRTSSAAGAAMVLALAGAVGCAAEVVSDVMRDSSQSADGSWGVLPGYEPVVVIAAGATALGLFTFGRLSLDPRSARGRWLALAAAAIGAASLFLVWRA